MRSRDLSCNIINISARSLRISYLKIHQSQHRQQQNHEHSHTNFRIVTNFSGAIPLVKNARFLHKSVKID